MNQDTGKGLVSIVLPTYNRAHLLAGAIEGVLNQTWHNLELIVVDDNSSDDTADVVARFSDPRVRYLKNDPNLKLPRALNRGFSVARGELLTWTSDDNFFAPNAIEVMAAHLEKSDCEFVYADYHLFAETDEAGRPLVIREERQPSSLQLERGNHIGACFLYTRRLYEAIGDYDPELFLVEDYDYFIRASRHFSFCHIAEPLYYFRRDDQTLYCSRYCEVKASDLLVRFKNDLLDEDGMQGAVVDLLMRQPAQLNLPLAAKAQGLLQKVSYRASQAHIAFVRRQLARRVDAALPSILGRFEKGEASFVDTRDRLCEMLRSLSRMEYA